MYYYTREVEGMTLLLSSTKLPKSMDGVVLITKEEYLEEHRKLAEMPAEQPEEEVNE